MGEMITIRKSEYDKLIAASEKLEALIAAGADNWDGYAYAMEVLQE